jgi:excisionase family DNA binding protein
VLILRESGSGLWRPFDVAIRLGYSTDTIKSWARQGKLPGAVFIGRHIRFDPQVIADFIARGGDAGVPPKITNP